MKITDIEAIPLRLPDVDDARCDGTQDALIIRVHTDEGLIGLGEVDSSPTVAKAIIDAPPSHMLARGLRTILVGHDPFDVQMLWHKMVEGTIYFGRSGAALQAIAGVDMALWDIVGQATGQPISKFLGGSYRDRIRVYASMIMPETPEEVHQQVSQLVAQGYTAIKLGWGPLGRVSESLDIELVRAAREAAGSRDLMLDIGLVWDAAQAIKMARRFEAFDVFWIEEPLPPDDLTGYARLADRVDVRIAAGEQETTFQGFVNLIEKGHVDVVQPDLARAGGLTPAVRLAQYAYDHNILCVPHAFSTGILVAASLHYVASMPHGQLAEFTVSESPIARDLLTRPFHLEADGTVRVPQTPGLGVQINEDVLRRYAQVPIKEL
ncbi:mandelate racemase/muconate lactonizing enzyme family protein [Dictyobacter formicarum]|uniref:Mandelate racemase n=1 Tax=Dictyobacter formicarum TaxID=2778368 RepID=A0ABQ3VXN3_9CHLR|nr:mandelate racemase/muconate lactonizing enzyme family protein [Dictyobacter formicarum]GHO89806.1 mandelate racemase [Dictyobacter formicarum]GHO89816.1 mandelate racemase [Dictyobacter formicarum]